MRWVWGAYLASVVTVSAAVLIVACAPVPPPAKTPLIYYRELTAGIGVWTDPETGCEYLSSYGNMTPRVARNSSNGGYAISGCR